MKVATIGSGIIVDRMIEAMKMTEGYEIYAVYSRTMERAHEFAEKHGVNVCYDDLDTMLKDDNIDIVYVASPNSLHYEQSKKALEAGKHVICEKPFVPTRKEADTLFDIAEKKGVYLFEAITNIHLPNYQIVKDHLKDIGHIQLIQCNYSQFSSRYNRYLAHEVTNAFDPAFNGGAMMDINVYCLHFVVGLLGAPESFAYHANIGFNGVDTSGIAILRYPEFLATCVGAKDSSSPNFVYIQGDKGTLEVSGSGCGVCARVRKLSTKGDMIGKKDTDDAKNIGIEQKMHMTYECEDFMSVLQGKNADRYQAWIQQTKTIVSLLEQAALQAR